MSTIRSLFAWFLDDLFRKIVLFVGFLGMFMGVVGIIINFFNEPERIIRFNNNILVYAMQHWDGELFSVGLTVLILDTFSRIRQVRVVERRDLLLDISSADNATAYGALTRLRNKNLLKKDDLIGHNLAGADLSRADLSNLSLEGAILRGTKLIDAILINTNLKDADISGANFTSSNSDNWDRVEEWPEVTPNRIDEKTILPDGKPWQKDIYDIRAYLTTVKNIAETKQVSND